MQERIYLSPPYIRGNEETYVAEAFSSNWIAPLGPHVKAFEEETAAYVGRQGALATNAGTAALHLALRYCGVGPGDDVFCSDFTFSGSCNPILYQGARPVFIDSEPETLNMSPAALEDAFLWAKKQNKLPKAVIIVDLYGQSADYEALLPLCARYGVAVIEDAAEALGATYRGKRCGAFGDIGALSFNGNKIVTTSGGGMVLSDDPAALSKMLYWATQAREPVAHYEHRDYGYNYRLSNVCAAIGRAQLEQLPHKLARRKELFYRYERLLAQAGVGMYPISEKGEPNYWLSVAVLDADRCTPEAVCNALGQRNIEARPAWKPMHLQPVFQDSPYFCHEGRDVGADFFQKGICLPSGEALTDAQQDCIVERIASLCAKRV